MINAESTGTNFDIDRYLEARALTIKAVQTTAHFLKAGMTESQAIEVLNQNLNSLGFEKFWHPTKLRMNANTTKNFRDPSDELKLTEDDLFFIDIGPVFLNHEGDYGETFVLGNNPLLINLRDATKKIFAATQDQWRDNNLTGVELYQFAETEAKKYNLRLNSNMYGHRLGDFPHAVHYKGKLGSLDFSPKGYLWVLEIHLIDDSINRGAFFEDILI